MRSTSILMFLTLSHSLFCCSLPKVHKNVINTKRYQILLVFWSVASSRSCVQVMCNYCGGGFGGDFKFNVCHSEVFNTYTNIQ